MKRKPVRDGMGSALVYCRVSTAKQEEKGTSLESQADACVAKAHELGYTVAEVVQEQHSGAELWERPKLAKAREDIKAGCYQALIIYNVDRLSREPAHLYIILEECERAGAELIFATEPLDKSEEGLFMLSVRGFVAKVERRKIRERLVLGKHKKALKGHVVRGGTDLYGYGFDPERGVRTINDYTAAVVRQIYRWAADGISTRAIIRRLNEQGTPPPSHGTRRLVHARYNPQPAWGGGAVKRILTDQTYKGEAYSWKWKSAGKGKVEARNVEEWIKLPEGAAPAIVEPELWATAQARLKANRGDQTRNEKRPDLLRGHVFCAECGRRMVGDNEHGKFRVYRCPSRHTPLGACGSARIPAADCEAAAWGQIESILNQPRLITSELARRKSEGKGSRKRFEADLERERQSLRRVESDIERIVMRSATADDDTLPTFEKLLAEKKDAKRRCEQAVAAATSRLTTVDANGEQVLAFRKYAARAQKRLASFGFEEKRLALEALNVRVNGNGRVWQLDVFIPNSCEVSQSICSLDRPARVKRCWRSGYQPFCRRWNLKRPWS